jgi:putative NADH-flavin reductase
LKDYHGSKKITVVAAHPALAPEILETLSKRGVLLVSITRNGELNRKQAKVGAISCLGAFLHV